MSAFQDNESTHTESRNTAYQYIPEILLETFIKPQNLYKKIQIFEAKVHHILVGFMTECYLDV